MAYEEARKLRLEENQKRFQELGITQISKSLNQSSTKTPQKRIPRAIEKSLSAAEPRRSSRVRTNIPSYRDDVTVDIGRTLSLRKSRHNSTWSRYIARPLHECKFASYEEKVGAHNAAEEFQSRLGSPHPSFVKSMVRSHVYSCFWLGLPSRFCVAHLPEQTVEIVLEDEKGEEYEAVYIGARTGLSGGWKRFALDHKLDDGDALLFLLIEPKRFKIYVFRGAEHANQRNRARQRGEDEDVEESGSQDPQRDPPPG
uniref:Putative B3 domain-containing protein n=1 Tax=Noccaea caerulescens TaxID=107243 RepID=A0A1J3J7J8_NOCCA